MEFATFGTGDARLDSRAIILAETIASSPDVGIPKACKDWARQTVPVPHQQNTPGRMRAHKTVLNIRDGAGLDFYPQPGGHSTTCALPIRHPRQLRRPGDGTVQYEAVQVHWLTTRALSADIVKYPKKP